MMKVNSTKHQNRTHELKEKIFNTAWEMKKNGYAEITIEITVRRLRMMGYRSISSTIKYMHLVNFESDDFTVKVAKTLDEACRLIEAGFEYVKQMDGVKIFRKRK